MAASISGLHEQGDNQADPPAGLVLARQILYRDRRGLRVKRISWHARRILQSAERMVFTIEDGKGRFLTLPVILEAICPDLIAIRAVNCDFPTGTHKGCLLAHDHSLDYAQFRQVVVYGDATIRGLEIRISPNKILVSQRRQGLLGDFKTGLKSSQRARPILKKLGQEPVSSVLLARAFGSTSARRQHDATH